MKKVLIYTLLLAFLFFVANKVKVYSIECDIGINLYGRSPEELDELISKCSAKKEQLSQKRSTLTSEVQYMDTQIYLTSLKIQDTEQKIINTQKEIDLLNTRIEGLDDSLSRLLVLFQEKAAETYRKRNVSWFIVLFDTNNATDFINQVKYIKTVQDNNQKLIVQVQQAKSNFEEQKKLREKKKIELDQLTLTLNTQKQSLNLQKVQKQKLLTDTQNDEATYQRILSQARAQMTALSTNVKSSGVGSPIGPDGLGKGSDGNYYSQRDSRWAYQTIGNSSTDCDNHPCSVLEAGCLISSISMTLKKKGLDINPSSIAFNLDYFQANTALMKYTLPVGSRKEISISEIDSQLENGNYVIVGINYGGCQYNSDHFVVLIKKNGGDYIMHDPLYGPDINFSSHYSQICHAEIL